MKRSFKLSLPILALIIGIAASAFTVQPASFHKNAKATTLYYWRINSDGSLGAYLGSFTSHAAAKAASGCPDDVAPDCARGYVSSTPPSNPSQNVQDRIEKN
jgi:hypothetical protein